MKKLVFSNVLKILGIFTLMIFLITCNDVFKLPEKSDMALVSILVSDETARTVLPQVTLDDVASYKLRGGLNGAPEIEIKTFISGGTAVSLEPGIWNFTLNAYNSSGEHILQGEVQDKQINLTGNNQVSFSLDVLKSGKGNIQITFNLPIEAGITQIKTNGDVASDVFNISSGNFVYSKNGITAGDYFINFEFYRGEILRTVISEMVLVRGNLTSVKTITLVGEDLKQVVTVTFNPNGGNWGGSTVNQTREVYKNTTVALPENPSRDNYIFNSWNTQAVGYGSVFTSANPVEDNIIVYAQWEIPLITVSNQTEWNAAVSTINAGGNGKEYIINIVNDFSLPGSTVNTFSPTDLTISIIGNGHLYLSSPGSLLNISNNQIILIDGTEIILEGLRSGKNNSNQDNNKSVLTVENGGVLELRSGKIKGNTINDTGYGGGVFVDGGTFMMTGGEITDNTVSTPSNIGPNYGGGGVYVRGGTFTMIDGKISGNTAYSSSSYAISLGGGVYVDSGIFTMVNGEISGNTSSSFSSLFAISYGGGVCVHGGTFTMMSGTIGLPPV